MQKRRRNRKNYKSLSKEGNMTEFNGYELLEEFRKRARHYCKGFGNEFANLIMQAEFYLEDRNPQQLANINRIAITLVETVNSMEISEGEPDYPLLLVAKTEVPRLKPTLDSIFAGEASVNSLHELYHLINGATSTYRKRLMGLRDEIRTAFGKPDFTLRTTDMTGKLWADALGKDNY